MRLFTALTLPPPVTAHLAGVIRQLGALPRMKDACKWTKEENLHVTLKFLGDVDDAHLPNLTTALKKIHFDPLPLGITRFLVLPGQGPARVLATSLVGDLNPLLDLFTQIESTVQPLGISREGRPFKPHVTLGRFKRPSLKHTALRLAAYVNPGLLPTPPFTATHATLFQSTLTPEGPIYTPLLQFP